MCHPPPALILPTICVRLYMCGFVCGSVGSITAINVIVGVGSCVCCWKGDQFSFYFIEFVCACACVCEWG